MTKDFISRIFRENSTLFWFLIILLLIIVFLVLDIFLGFIKQTEIISKGQLIVETLGLVALIVAIFEFIEISKKPKLKLWAEIKHEHEFESLSKDTIDKYLEKNTLVKTRGIVDQDIIKAYLYHYRFKLYIENFGQKIGRFVKVTIKLSGTDNEKSVRDKTTSFTRIGNSEIGVWLLAGLSRGTHGNFQRFHGGENFVVYSHPQEINNLKDWLELLGEFSLNIPINVGEENIDLYLDCTIQAEDFDLETQTFRITIPQTN